MNSTKLKNITFLQIMKFFKWSRWYHICFFDKPFFRTQSLRAFQTEAFFRMKLIYGFIPHDRIIYDIYEEVVEVYILEVEGPTL